MPLEEWQASKALWRKVKKHNAEQHSLRCDLQYKLQVTCLHLTLLTLDRLLHHFPPAGVPVHGHHVCEIASPTF